MRTFEQSIQQTNINTLFHEEDAYTDNLITEIFSILKEFKTNNFTIPKGYSNLEDYVYQWFYRRKNIYNPFLVNLNFPNNYFYGFKNHSKEFSEEWVAESPVDGGGRIIVSKNNYERKLLLPGTFINQNQAIDINDVKQKIKIGIPDSELKLDKYVHFYGESISDELGENKNIIRLYFNFNPLAQFVVPTTSSISIFLELFQTKFAEVFFAEFNDRKIPFHLKIAKSLVNFYADSVVLYLERRYLLTLLDFFETHYTSFSSLLRDEVPMFTFPVYKGIGFAEGIDPIYSEESFGTSRSVLIVKVCREVKSQTDEEVKNEIKRLLKKYHRHTDFFLFLNKKSKFEYRKLFFADITDSKNVVINKDSLLNTAVQLGYTICKEAFWDNRGRCNWIAFQDSKTYKPLNLSYLDGLSGVLLYLAETYKISGVSLFKRYGIGLLNTIFSKVRQYKKELQNRGFHKGSGGLIYAVQKAIICFDLGDDWQTKFNNKIVDKIFEEQQFQNEPYDVYGGTAGTLWGLLLMKKMLGNKFIYDDKVTELKNIFLNYQGLWKTDRYFNDSIKKKHEYLVGFPHGVTGIAYVLGLYQQLYNSSEFDAIINEAIEFEQQNRRFQDVWLTSDNISDTSRPADEWEKALSGVGFSQIALHKLGLNNYYNGNIKAIVDFMNPTNTISLDFLIRYVSSGVLDFYVEYNANSVIAINLLDTLNPIIDEFKEGNLMLRGIKNDATQPFIHSGLVGFAGFGMSILRLYDSTVSSYILPS